MESGERRFLDPSEIPTQPSIRLPLPPLPASLPRVPLVGGQGDEDGGPWPASGAFPVPADTTIRKEIGHGGG
jgi:hypothetical protein